jgi:hypothetical protein
MLARCARCQGTFTTDTFGLQTCPHCGSELMLADPKAPPGAAPAEAPAGAPPPPPPPAQGPGELPPPPPPPAGGYAGYGGFSPPPYGPPPGFPGPPAAPPPGGGRPSPFAERATRGFLPAWLETFKLVALQPSDFFRLVRTDQPGAAVLFGVVSSVVGAVLAGLYNVATIGGSIEALQKWPATNEMQRRFVELYLGWLQDGTFSKVLLAQVVLSPLLSLIGIYLAAGVIHLALMLFKGAPRGFEATLTVVAYASGLGILNGVPVCGSLVAQIWWVVAVIIGLDAAQRCGLGKSTVAVLAPLLLACVCCCGALGVGMSFAMQALAGAAAQPGAPLNL